MKANTYVVKPFGISEVKVIALKGDPGTPTQEQINTAVDEYMTEHPEAQIPDGSITEQKLSSNVVATLNDVDNKADKVGYYPGLIAGTADNLLSSSYQTDRTPYILRRTPYGARERGSIVGGSIVWNQLVKSKSASATINGITWTNNGDGTWTANGTATADSYKDTDATFQCPTDHVCFVSGCPSGGSSSTYYVQDGYRAVGYSGDFGSGRVYKKVTNSTICRMYVKNGTTANSLVFKPQIIDLTLMFGSDIADYIYAQEQATAGAGVALAKALAGITADYYPYDAGSIKSVTGLTSHKMTGKNLLEIGNWTSVTSQGLTATNNGDGSITINGTASFTTIVVGNLYLGTAGAASKQNDHKKHIPNGRYLCTTGVSATQGVGFQITGSNGSDVSTIKGIYVSAEVDIDDTYQYNWVRIIVAAGTYNNVTIYPMIRYADVQDATFEPYTAHEYPLDSSLTLRGIPTLVGDHIEYDGDIYPSSGEVQRTWSTITLNGSETWTAQGSSGWFYTNLNTLIKANDYTTHIRCDKLAVLPRNVASTDNTYVITGYYDSQTSYPNRNWIYVYLDSTHATRETLTAWLAENPVTIVYRLAEPTTEQAEPYTVLQICDRSGTEEWVGASIPVGHDTKYYADLKGKIEDIPDAPSADGTYTLKVTVSNGVATYSWG